MLNIPEWMQDSKRIEQARRDYVLQTHPEQMKAFENISTLIEKVRRCWTPEDYRTVQQLLGQHIEYVDAKAENAHVAHARAKSRLRRFHQKGIPPESNEAAQAQANLNQAEFDHELYLKLGRQYRTVGDALAWQFYGFKALPIYALGMNTSPGIISRSKQAGADAEVEAIEKLWREEKIFALRHDYTNCLRVGDLSVLYSDHPDTPEFLEIKVKGRSVASRQKNRRWRAIELVRHQVMTQLDGTVLTHRAYTRRTSGKTPETNLGLLWRALLRTKTESIGSASNTYLVVQALDMTIERSIDQRIRDWQKLKEIPPEIETPPCTDYLIGFSHQKASQVGFGAPYSIYPLPASYASGIITGFLRVQTRLNTAALTQAFQHAGFEAECLLNNLRTQGLESSELKGDTDYFRLRRGGLTILIASSPIGQILFEGLPVEDFVASISDCYEASKVQKDIIIPGSPTHSTHRSHVLSTYTNMEQVWQVSREFIEPYEAQTSDGQE